MFLQVKTQTLFPGGFPTYHCYRGFTELALFGQKCDQVGIGLAVHRWRGNPDFERAAMDSANFVPAGTGLDADVNQQIITLPVVPGGHA